METALQNLSKKSITSAISVVKITLCSLKAGPQRARKLELAGILPEDVKYDDMDHNLGSTSQGSCKMCSKNTKICVRNIIYDYMPKRGLCFEKYHCN